MGQFDFNGAGEYALEILQERLSPILLYHGIHHTRDDVLPSAERLAALAGVMGEDLLLLRTAALYHDVGYVQQYFKNEPIAVQWVQQVLPDFGYTPAQIEVVASLILATQMPQAPHTFLEELLCDADLDSLGREDFLRTSLDLRAELATQGISRDLPTWYTSQLNFLEAHGYYTEAAHLLRDAGKAANIALLKALLHGA